MKKFFLTALLFSSAAIYSDTPYKVTGTENFAIVPVKNLYNAKITEISGGKKGYALDDLSYQRRPEAEYVSDMVLSFNNLSSSLMRDDTGKYKIKYSQYNFREGNSALGRGAAEFFKADHRVEIAPSGNLWLGSCDDLGSFTIEFRLKPYSFKDGSMIFSRIAYLSGGKRGIEIFLNNGRVCAVLYGLYQKGDGYRGDAYLVKGRQIDKNRWAHFSLSYDRKTGQLLKQIDGREEESVFLTESGESGNGVYPLSYGADIDGEFKCSDMPSAVIGKNYSGMLDEFRISNRFIKDLETVTRPAYKKHAGVDSIGRNPVNTEGIVKSPVYSFPLTGTMITMFQWGETLRKNSFVWMEIRMSDRKFSEDDTDIKWHTVKNDQRKIFLKKIENDEYLRGKYYQWRAHLVASPGGKNSPELYNVRLNYQLDVPPAVPLFLEAASSGSEFVVLRWKKNREADILGYRIYYGTISGKYDGVISTIEGKKITNDVSAGDFIEIKVTNEVIEENLKSDKKGILSFPKIKNSVLYFFSVSAYDSYKPDTQYNHESALSRPVNARPFSGSEID